MPESSPDPINSSASSIPWSYIYLLVVGSTIAAIGGLYFFSQYYSS